MDRVLMIITRGLCEMIDNPLKIHIGDIITFLLVVIRCQNSYFGGHYSTFSVSRLKLPMVILIIERI